MLSTKICFKCSKELMLSEFHKHSKMKDGHLNKCKSCACSDTKKHQLKNKEYYKQYDKQRSKLPHRIELNTKLTYEYRIKYPERYKAVTMLGNAVRDGKIQKLPCFVCGDSKVVGHHSSYDLPLDVIWLCQTHHKECHS